VEVEESGDYSEIHGKAILKKDMALNDYFSKETKVQVVVWFSN